MGRRHQHRPWAAGPDTPWQAHGGRRGQGWVGPGWGEEGRGRRGPGGFGGPGGPPPWVAGLFGLGQPERGRGPRVRRGDVRVAILDVLARAGRDEEPINGYQVIQQIAERSDGAWRPSPGSVYPTIQQLQDEGLVESDDERGRKTLRLTDAGRSHVEEHADELAAVWAPFERDAQAGADQASKAAPDAGEPVDLRSELGRVMPAVWQILTQGTDAQRRAALDVLVDARRRLYGVLADGPEGVSGPEEGADA